jgi:hypothetical protein
MRSVDCAVVRDAFRAGRLPDEPSALAHVRDCPRCTELLADDARLGRALASGHATAEPSPELWAAVERRLVKETGARAWLRSRSTALRVALSTAVGALIVVLAHRGDHVGLAERSGLEPTVWIFGFAGLALAAVAWGLRPLGRARSAASRAVLLSGAAALPVLYSLTTAEVASSGTSLVRGAVGCFAMGLALAVPFVVVLWLADRADRLATANITLFAAAGGLLANLGLALHCPSNEQAHLLLGHAPVALGVALTLVAARALLPRRSFR